MKVNRKKVYRKTEMIYFRPQYLLILAIITIATLLCDIFVEYQAVEVLVDAGLAIFVMHCGLCIITKDHVAYR